MLYSIKSYGAREKSVPINVKCYPYIHMYMQNSIPIILKSEFRKRSGRANGKKCLFHCFDNGITYCVRIFLFEFYSKQFRLRWKTTIFRIQYAHKHALTENSMQIVKMLSSNDMRICETIKGNFEQWTFPFLHNFGFVFKSYTTHKCLLNVKQNAVFHSLQNRETA